MLCDTVDGEPRTTMEKVADNSGTPAPHDVNKDASFHLPSPLPTRRNRTESMYVLVYVSLRSTMVVDGSW